MIYRLNKKNKISKIFDGFTKPKKCHEDIGHPGFKQMQPTLKKLYNGENFIQIIKKICNTCITCLRNETRTVKYGHVQGSIKSKFPNKLVSSEILGQIKTKHFKTYQPHEIFHILTIKDVFTRFTEVCIIFDIKPKTVQKIIKKVYKETWCTSETPLQPRKTTYQ